jgi:hypothetical protein
MTDERKKPGAGFWAAVAVVVVLAYPVLFGPACWPSSRTGRGADIVSAVYRPIFYPFSPRALRSPGRVLGFLEWYAEVGSAPDWHWEHAVLFNVADVFVDEPNRWMIESSWRSLRQPPSVW